MTLEVHHPAALQFCAEHQACGVELDRLWTRRHFEAYFSRHRL